MSSGKKIKLVQIVGQHIRDASFEWLAQEIDRERFDLDFVIIDNGHAPLADYLDRRALPYSRIRCAGPSDLARTARAVCRYCLVNKPDVVHTHYGGNLPGLFGAMLARVPVRLFYRHYTGAPHRRLPLKMKGFTWLNNHCSTHVIASDELVRDVLLAEGVAPRRISIIPFGFDLDAFASVPNEAVAALRKKYLAADAYPVVGIVSRCMELKGIQYVVPAFRRLLVDHPRAFLVHAGAYGPYESEVNRLFGSLPPDSYVRVRFEDDLYSLFRLFDVFVHVPVSPGVEAFGRVYVEAMAAGVPSVITLSGIALEYAEHMKNAWVVEHRNSEQIYRGIKELIENAHLRESIVAGGCESVRHSFYRSKMTGALQELYARLARGP
jgi:glycosyltransferase involved in cell wall biosynthesis